jgi:hypothetical protein
MNDFKLVKYQRKQNIYAWGQEYHITQADV